jgi:drug/metabolite transporter (DMT)-like permease
MSAQTQQRPSGNAGFFIVLVASTFLMGSSFISGKILLSAGFPPTLLAGWRFLLAALATLPLVLLDGPSVRQALIPVGMSLRDWALVLVIGLAQTTAVMGLLFLSMRLISASTAAILLFTNPIWVAVLGRLFLGESLHRARLAGLLIGMVGVSLAIGFGAHAASGPGALTGELIGLASALCWAVATIVNKRANLPLRAWSLSFWQMLIGSFFLLAIAYGIGDRWPATTSNAQWGWFLWLAIPASTGSFGLWFVALNKGGATRTSGYLFLAPVFTVVLSVFVLNTSLSWVQALGGVLIGLALWLVNRELPARTKRERINEAIAEGEL